MAKYICPVCDRPIEGKYYCSCCKSFVKNAYLSRVDYYLNESHPDTELNCEYHSKMERNASVKIHPAKAEAKTSSANRPSANRPSTNRPPTIQPMPKLPQRPGQRPIASKNSGSIIPVIIWVIILFNMLRSCAG